MKAASISEIKKELKHRSSEDLLELCLRMGKFKKENKELLTYLLFESIDEGAFIEGVKAEVDEQFELINTKNYYYIKKSIRKILANIKKHIRYSKNKETEVELLLYFCWKLKDFKPSIKRNTTLKNLYDRQIVSLNKLIAGLHEDLQYDYTLEMEDLLK
ncbi:hypothetical protein L1I30_01485 [Gillisia sp. M10.2A]|uniref:Uncharacterized protein n=1 Tax=Gillisia lutea TaxID=2909668 RepID=A0ABS9EBQ9_9FLAO|nr:hypothetical protein [Gillisia lutea]MCF4100326.1 hypothetical protein [Gillisia lutea]